MPTGDLTASDKASESNSILHQATRASVPGLTGPLALSGCLVADPMATTQAEATISLPPSLKRLYHWRRPSCRYSVQLMAVQLCPTELHSTGNDEQRRMQLLLQERPHRNHDWIRVCAIFDGVSFCVGAAESILGRRMEECSSPDALFALSTSTSFPPVLWEKDGASLDTSVFEQRWDMILPRGG